MRPLKIIIDAQMPGDGTAGGVQHFTASLVSALGRLSDGPEEYIIVGPRHGSDWLLPLLGPNQRLVTGPASLSGGVQCCRRLLGYLGLSLDRLYRELQRGVNRPLFSPRVPQSSGFYESLGGNIIHFPHQRFVATELPAIYNPHDLQHLHYPEFFTRHELAQLDVTYRVACETSASVAAASMAVKEDVSTNLHINPDKIQVILLGPPTELYQSIDQEDLLRTGSKFRLPDSFVLYPAQTWPHKNHLRLLEAVALLKSKHGLVIRLICTGNKNFYWPTIEAAIRTLELSDQVSFPGFVTTNELQALYRLARFVVFPSLFEAGGFPVIEALRAGAPLACSDIAPLREYAGQAAFFMEAHSVESIAHAIRSLTADDQLRSNLREKGYEWASRFSWSATARTYRALYRKIAGSELNEDDLGYLHRNGMGPEPEVEAGGAP